MSVLLLFSSPLNCKILGHNLFYQLLRGSHGPVFLACGVIVVLSCTTARAQETGNQEAIPLEILDGRISRAQFTSTVENREPIDALTQTSTDLQKLFFFTEFMGLAGQTLIHRWFYFDEIVAEIPFDVKGPRWRVHSYKSLSSDLSGTWSVEVVTPEGFSLGKYFITVEQSIDAAVVTNEESGITQITHSELISENAPVEPKTSESNHGVTETEYEQSDMVRDIQRTFPNGYYTLINDSFGADDCPQSGNFNWESPEQDLWVLNMGGAAPIRLYDREASPSTLTPDPLFDNLPQNCLMYTNHFFDSHRQSLVTELQSDCRGQHDDIFSVHALTKSDDTVDLSMHGERYVVCRYQLQ